MSTPKGKVHLNPLSTAEKLRLSEGGKVVAAHLFKTDPGNDGKAAGAGGAAAPAPASKRKGLNVNKPPAAAAAGSLPPIAAPQGSSKKR